ncbi:hypothetical protein CHS0354_005317 [Potamilus streckersoni]|uniref:Uncharacterized protein n=1 Tax=Potamilus streckersoni TaxID=2493646 RepID=A0AAE0SG34_9BIVA|nr:hypothetical protein CHS0354_005317 [Potamilus streckersoni]
MRVMVCLVPVTLVLSLVLADTNIIFDNIQTNWEPMFRFYGGGNWHSRNDYILPNKSMDDDHDDEDRAQFRSFQMERWENDINKKVKLELFDDGRKVHELVFDGDFSNKTSWFSPQKLQFSSWKDLSSQFIGDEFSVDGDRDDDNHWTIRNKKSVTCDEEGWLTVIDKPRKGRNRCVCSYEDIDDYPAILYSRDSSKTKWSSGNYGVADMMQISINKFQQMQQPQTQAQPRRFRK